MHSSSTISSANQSIYVIDQKSGWLFKNRFTFQIYITKNPDGKLLDSRELFSYFSRWGTQESTLEKARIKLAKVIARKEARAARKAKRKQRREPTSYTIRAQELESDAN